MFNRSQNDILVEFGVKHCDRCYPTPKELPTFYCEKCLRYLRAKRNLIAGHTP